MQKIAAFLGAWWSGKSTHAIHVREIFELIKPLNYTTREKRGKKDIDYTHISVKEFQQKLMQWELFNSINFDGNLYWFDNENIENTNELILCITPQAIDYIKEYAKKTNAELITIFFDTPEQELRRRILKRGVSKEETEKRIVTDQIEIRNRPHAYDYILDTEKPWKDVRIELMPILEGFFSR